MSFAICYCFLVQIKVTPDDSILPLEQWFLIFVMLLLLQYFDVLGVHKVFLQFKKITTNLQMMR